MGIGNKEINFKNIKKVKPPTKNYINILVKNEKEFSLKKNLPIVILIALLFLAFCKFMVVDRLIAVSKSAKEVVRIQNELNEANAKIAEKKDLDEMYAHYTISGMTEEELSRVDRVDAMKLVETVFQKGNNLSSWNITGNVMTLQVTGASLQDLSKLGLELEQDPIVERCVVSSANKNTKDNSNVAVSIIIYLKPQTEGGAKK
jgi:hypothetical protein